MALLATSLLLSLAVADSQLNFVNTTSDEKFDDYIEAANASTAREIELPNIHTNQYPSQGEDITWKAWLKVDEEDARGGLIYGGLHPDEEYISDNSTIQSDDSWLMCMRLTRFRNSGLNEPIQSNCSNVFPDDCLQFLNEISEDGRLCLNSTLPRDQWEDSPCSNALHGEHTRHVLEPDQVFRATHLSYLTTATSIVEEDGGPDERYDALVESVYMLAVGFARAGNRENTIDRDAQTVPSKLICMRADEFSEGSRTLEDIEDMGVEMRAPVGWIMVLASLVVMTTGML